MKCLIISFITILLTNSCKTSLIVTDDSSSKEKKQTIIWHDIITDSDCIIITDTIKPLLKCDTIPFHLVSENKSSIDSLKLRSMVRNPDTLKIINPVLPKIKVSENVTKQSNLEINKPVVIHKENTKKYNGFKSERIDFKGKSFDVVKVDVRFNKVNFFYRDPIEKEALLTFDNTLKINPDMLMLMNGGMYAYTDKNSIRPVGLYVESGCEINRLDTCTNRSGNFYMQPNGVFLIDNTLRPNIVKSADYILIKSKVLYATQSGPMLVINDKINPLLKKNSINTNIRNGVGLSDTNTLVFIISNEPVNFYDFACLFKDKYSCKQALYLDGAISGAVIPSLKRDDSVNRNQYAVFIGIEPKK